MSEMIERIIGRKEARALGLKHYFTGESCSAGHLVKRFVSSKACIECHNKRVREWRRAHASEVYRRGLPVVRRWREENRRRVIELRANWKKAHPDYVRERGRIDARNRRARLREVEGTHTLADEQAIIARQKGRCAACKKKRKLTIDHRVPIAKGGRNDAANLQGLCSSCNSRKQAQDEAVFMRSIGLLL